MILELFRCQRKATEWDFLLRDAHRAWWGKPVHGQGWSRHGLVLFFVIMFGGGFNLALYISVAGFLYSTLRYKDHLFIFDSGWSTVSFFGVEFLWANYVVILGVPFLFFLLRCLNRKMVVQIGKHWRSPAAAMVILEYVGLTVFIYFGWS